MQDNYVDVMALHASSAGWQAPKWLTNVGGMSPNGTHAPENEPTSQADTCKTRVAMNSPESSDDERMNADSSSASSDSSSGDSGAGQQNADHAHGAAFANGAKKTDSGLDPEVQETAFKELDTALLGNFQKHTILQVGRANYAHDASSYPT